VDVIIGEVLELVEGGWMPVSMWVEVEPRASTYHRSRPHDGYTIIDRRRVENVDASGKSVPFFPRDRDPGHPRHVPNPSPRRPDSHQS
jgi:hypothetical protein